MGAGKTTHSKSLAAEKNAVLISEDEWLSRLFPNQIENFEDYRHYAARLRPLVEDHVTNVLKTGTDVVLDFAANTERQRNWFRDLYNAAQAKGQLIYVKASDETCLAQLAKRRVEQPERALFDNASVFEEVSSYFQEPDDQEGFDIEIIIRG
jgi:predicted kinase